MKKATVLLVVFLTGTGPLPICHAGNCRQIGDQIYCDTNSNGHIVNMGIIERRKSPLSGLPEVLAKGIELRNQGKLVNSQAALLEEQRQNSALDRQIKEEQLKQIKSRNIQQEVREFAQQHKDFEQFRPAMYKISLNPQNANLSLQELYDRAKAGYTE